MEKIPIIETSRIETCREKTRYKLIEDLTEQERILLGKLGFILDGCYIVASLRRSEFSEIRSGIR